MTGGSVGGDLLAPEDVVSLLLDDPQLEQKLKEIPLQVGCESGDKNSYILQYIEYPSNQLCETIMKSISSRKYKNHFENFSDYIWPY